MKRRSATQEAPRKRYTNDAFEGIEELQETLSSHEDARPEHGSHDDDSVEEFEAPVDEPSDEDSVSAAEVSDIDAGEDAGDAQFDEDVGSIGSDDVEDSPAASRFLASDFTPIKSRIARKRRNATGALTYTRGINEIPLRSASKPLRRLLYFGPNDADSKPFYDALAKWALDATLPTRTSNQKGQGGMRESRYMDSNAWASEAKRWREWWVYGGGKDVPTKRQLLERLDVEAAQHYMPEKQGEKLRFVMGPFSQQKHLALAAGESLSLQGIWSSANEGRAPHLPSEDARYGYMLNVGAKVQCLDWAPNLRGKEQYLAVSVSNTAHYQHSKTETQHAPAFAPQPAHKSNLQIWKFQSTNGGRIDLDTAPHVQSILCAEWGDAKSLKWCPLSDNDPQSDEFGLLAGIWPDGATRVLYVPLRSESTETATLQIKSALLEARPPSTVCTCLTWISPTKFATGCANGCLAVWDLSLLSSETPTNVRPSVYSAIQNSYILSVASGSPSRPNLVFTSSMGGFLAMSDLSSSAQSLTSQMSTVFSNRNRVGTSLLTWHDFAQIDLHVDDHYMLRGTVIRRFFTTNAYARYKSAATSLATSPCHPFVLVGTANGDVVSSNPMKRIMNGKANNWQQTLFSHEWRRPTEDELQRTNAAAALNDSRWLAVALADGDENGTVQIGENGLSRILEGYKVERCVLFKNDKPNQMDGVPFATIYEEKSAISALAWNPNPHVGGWIAVGMGDGLLRVEDVALDPSE